MLTRKRTFVIQGAPENAQCSRGSLAKVAAIEVEMTKGTREPQLPGRTQSPERNKKSHSVEEEEGW